MNERLAATGRSHPRGCARFSPDCLCVTVLAGLLAASAFALAPSPARAQANLPAGFTDELVLGGFTQPVGMAFLPDGRLLVIDQATYQIRTIVNGAFAGVDPAMTVPSTVNGGERGLLGIAVDPGWPGRPYLYVHATSAGSVIRVSRFRAAGDLSFTGNGDLTVDPASRYDLITNIPDAASNHNGGTVRFGTDGMLYVSLGEDAVPRAAQDTTSLRGVILRLDVSRLPDGPGTATRALITPTGNPFSSTGGLNARLLWAWGLRNPFRFHVDPANGNLWIGDVGQSTWEELNLADGPGRNFGWPRYEGTDTYDGTAPLVGPTTNPIHALGRSQTNARSIMSAGVYRRPAGATKPWPNGYEGSVFLTDYFAGVMRRLVNTGGVWNLAPPESGQASAQNWATGLGYVTDWAVGPDGSMWYCRQVPGEIRRIVADSTASPPPPTPPPTVDFRSPYPSPASGPVVFDFDLGQESRVRLTVYDMRGARVRDVLVDDAAPVGLNRAVWDGYDDDGRLVDSGLYFALLEVDGRTYSRRVPIVR